MSLFDPHRLYRKAYRKSHKGQIIQQRPTETKSALSQQDIDKAVKIVRSLNLTTGREIEFYIPFYGLGSFVWDTVSVPAYNTDYNSVFLTVNNFISSVPVTDDFWASLGDVLRSSRGQLTDISIALLMRSEHFTTKLKNNQSSSYNVDFVPTYPGFLPTMSPISVSMQDTTEVSHIIPTLLSSTTIRFDKFEQPYGNPGSLPASTSTTLALESPTGSLSVIDIGGISSDDLAQFYITKRVPSEADVHVHDMSFRQNSTTATFNYEMHIYTTFDIVIGGKMIL